MGCLALHRQLSVETPEDDSGYVLRECPAPLDLFEIGHLQGHVFPGSSMGGAQKSPAGRSCRHVSYSANGLECYSGNPREQRD